jgi:TP901 family phage tail tape measure protein
LATTRQVRAGAAYVELTTRDAQLVRGLQRAAKRLNSFAASARTVGMQLATASGLAAVPLALSTKAFASFEQQMARVKALTNANAEDFGKLESLAKKMGATTVFSASQAAQAMSYFALAGFKTDQIMDALGPTLNLAAAGQIEIAEAADIAAKIMSGMGIGAADLGNAIDVMAKAMTTANTDLTMLGEAFKFVGPMAKTAGISLEEITAAIQLLSNAGVQGEMAGTTLRGMLLSLTSPSAEASKELNRLGVRVLDSAGNVRSLTGIVTDLENALAGVGSGEKLRVLGTIFPARQAAGAAELVSQGAKQLRDATIALGDAAGTASKIAGTQLDTLQGDFTILLSSLEGLGIAVGKLWAPRCGKSLKASPVYFQFSHSGSLKIVP